MTAGRPRAPGRRAAAGLLMFTLGVLPVTGLTAGGVYQIGVLREDGGRSTGSAVQIGPGVLVANCHTVRSAQDIVVLHANRPFRARLEQADARHDLCLLRTARFSLDVPERVTSDQLKVGDEVAAFGFASGFRMSIARGRVTALHVLDDAHVIRTSARFPRGASGGALYDARGRLIGVLAFRARDAALNYALPMEWLERLLLTDSTAVPDPRPQAFWEAPFAEQPDFMRVAHLEYGSQWEAMLDLARAWSARDAHDAEAWRSQGRALLGLGDATQARQALEHATTLAPGSVDAWYWLARAAQDTGATGTRDLAQARVADLDAELAAELSAELARAAGNRGEAPLR